MMTTRPAFVLTLVTVLSLLPSLLAPAQARPFPPQTPATQTPAPAVQSPAKDSVAGVRNFMRVDATFACGGALAPGAIESIKQAGFRSIVNLRAAGEEGADVEAQKAAAEAAGLTYIWLPFVPTAPTAEALDKFLVAVRDPANQPMLLHCFSGVRASMFWAVKRVLVDGWPVDRAMNELPEASKRASEPLRTFFLDYLKQHAK